MATAPTLENVTRGEFRALYEKGALIGKGNYAEVFEGRCKSTGRVVAMKVVVADIERGLVEAEMLGMVRHPNVLRVVQSFRCEDRVVMVMGKVDSTLKTYLISKGIPSENDAKSIVRNLFSGLHYLHTSLNIAHRDVKPENLLIDCSLGRPNLQIIDLGLGCYLPQNNKATACTPVGTAKTMSRRLLEAVINREAKVYATKNDLIQWDIYAAGVVCFNMLCQRSPYQGATPADLVRSMEKPASTAFRSSAKYLSLPAPAAAFLQAVLVSTPSSCLDVMLSTDWLDMPDSHDEDDDGDAMFSARGSCCSLDEAYQQTL